MTPRTLWAREGSSSKCVQAFGVGEIAQSVKYLP